MRVPKTAPSLRTDHVSPPSRPELHRALGESTRYAVYAYLSSAGTPQTINQISDAVGLHVNTIRSHLDRLKEVGLVTSEPAEHTKVGRPHHLFSVTPAAMLVEQDPFSGGLTVELLSELIGQLSIPADTVETVGRAHGDALVHGCERGGDERTLTECANALAASQCASGFEPTLTGGGTAEPCVELGFGRCGFEPLLQAQPAIACQLHEGVVRGFAEALGCAVDEFHADVVGGPCWARLVSATDLHQTAHNEGKKK